MPFYKKQSSENNQMVNDSCPYGNRVHAKNRVAEMDSKFADTRQNRKHGFAQALLVGLKLGAAKAGVEWPPLAHHDPHWVHRALRAAHSGFYLSAKTVSIGLIGPGTVGSALLRQIEAQHARLEKQFNLDLRVRGIARSGKMLLGDRRIDPRIDGVEDRPVAEHRPVDETHRKVRPPNGRYARSARAADRNPAGSARGGRLGQSAAAPHLNPLVI